MSLPEPTPGLVIGYAYLWREQAQRGLEAGSKDRSCVIVPSTVEDDFGSRRDRGANDP